MKVASVLGEDLNKKICKFTNLDFTNILYYLVQNHSKRQLFVYTVHNATWPLNVIFTINYCFLYHNYDTPMFYSYPSNSTMSIQMTFFTCV